MPDAGQWYTVKEFAAEKQISTQAVYKQLATSLKPYCKKENGRTFIHSDALTLQPLQPEFATDATKLQTSCKPAAEAAALDALRDLIDRQAAELEQIRAQLDAAQEDLTEARQAAAVAAAERDAERQRADDLRTALQTAQQSQTELAAALTAAQALHAGTIRGQLETTAEAEAQTADRSQAAPPEPEEKPRGLFARLFKKR